MSRDSSSAGHTSGYAKRRTLFGVGAALLLVAGGAYWAFGHSKHTLNKPVIERDVPHLEGDVIVFSPGFRQRAGVEYATVNKRALTPTVRLVGTATFDPSHVAAVGTRVRGFVRNTFKYEGDEVKPGEALAEIESADIGQAQADVEMAKAQHEAAQLNSKREAELLEKNLTTSREAELATATLTTSKAALDAARQRVMAYGGGRGPFGVFLVRSPIAGSVVEHAIAPGQSVESNHLAYKVADLRHLWIELAVPERSAGIIRTGDEVHLTPVGNTSQKFRGSVAHVGEVIDLASRSAHVRISVDNHDRLLRPGQSVFATLSASGGAHEALVIPQSAVAYVDGAATVFVSVGDDKVKPATIRLGASDETNIEVLEGLQEGQKIASSGVFPLKSELFR